MASKSKKVVPLPVGLSAEPEALPRVLPIAMESLARLGRENLAALAKANLALSAGLGAMGEELIDYAKSTLASASEAATALLGAKTLDEVLELNNGLAKTALDSLMARSTKLQELGISTTNEALAPFGGRFEAALASLKRPAIA